MSDARWLLLLFMVMLLVALAVVALPQWPNGRRWNHYPAGGIALTLLVLAILLMLGWL